MENLFRIELNLCGIVIAVIVIWLFFNQIKKKNTENKVFLVLAYLTIIELVLDSILWLVDGQVFSPGREINMIVNTLYYFLQILQCYIWMAYCTIHMDAKRSRKGYCILAAVFMIGVLLLVVNLWTGCVFTVDALNVYKRGWGICGGLEVFCCLFYPLYCIGMVIVKMIKGDKEKKKDGRYLLLVSAIPIVSSIIQMVIYGLNFIWIGMSLALLLVLVEIEVKQYQKMQEQLTEQKIQIMLSQIQPHFLYNSLSSIEYLCDENPLKAKEAAISFSKYLRGNLESLKQRHPISFETKLKHIEIYLSLEKMRFEENLNVVYNIRTKNFCVPSLTIQPLVKNAVKYGVGQKEECGMVCIDTKEEAEDFVITINDDGVGFNPYDTQYDGRSHIGIENVKSRLKTMCNGTLKLESKPSHGTRVIVKIPKEDL